MASIFKPTYTKTDPKTGKRIKRKARKWYVQYKDQHGRWKRVPGYVDREATRQLAAQLERKVERLQSGLTDPFDDEYKRPITEHVADFRRSLEAKENTPYYVSQTVSRIESAVAGCQFKRITELDGNKLADWLAEQRSTRADFGIKTSNYYLGAMKQFSRWLVRSRRMPADPLIHLDPLNALTDVRVERRSLSQVEFERLLQVTKSGPNFRSMTGDDRWMLYVVAATTGLRANELHSLTAGSLDTSGQTPVLHVQAGYSKRRRRDAQPLRGDIAALLAEWTAGMPRDSVLWPGSWFKDGAEMIRADLEAARQSWIEEARDDRERQQRIESDFLAYEDANGRVFDFHALRHQFISSLAAAGVHPKTAQTLARHSSITLTMDRYTHVGLADIAGALDSLPQLQEREQQKNLATGTDGRLVQASKELAQTLARQTGLSRPSMTAPGTSPDASNYGIIAASSGHERSSVSTATRMANPKRRATSPVAADGSR